MDELQRVTTEYVEIEDRIRLAGEVAPDRTVVLWLTQRMLNILLPHLLEWLEGQTPAPPTGADGGAYTEVIQSFAQQAARAQLTPQAPVRVPAADPARGASAGAAWCLVQAVDVTRTEQEVRLVFKGAGPTEPASLAFQSQPLRQWLAILHDQYARAGWPLDVWPAWMEESAAPASSAQPVAVH